MTAEIILLPIVRVDRAPDPPPPILSPRHRRRLKSIAAEWGVGQDTAVVMILTQYFDAERSTQE